MKEFIKNKPDLLVAIIVLVIIWIPVSRLTTTDWTDNLSKVELILFIGYIIGLLFGTVRIRKSYILPLGIIIGVVIIILQMGLTIAEPMWSDRIIIVYYRIEETLFQFINSEPVEDPILFILSMGILFWWIGFIAGYQIPIHKYPWLPVLIAGISLIIINYYHPISKISHWYTAIYTLGALLLLGRLSFINNRVEWHKNKASIEYDTEFEFNKTMIISGLVMVIIAWNIPNFILHPRNNKGLSPSIKNNWIGVKNKFICFIVLITHCWI